MSKVPADIYERVHEIMLGIANAAQTEDEVLGAVYYEQLREFCERQTAGGRGSGFLWEALADVTDHPDERRAHYERALAFARQNSEPIDTILDELRQLSQVSPVKNICSLLARVVCSLVAFAAVAPLRAADAPPAPILDGYTADPAIRVFGDTYYVYPTSDKPNWLTTDFSVWSSKDLIHWKKDGMILDVTRELKWANLRAWAPDAIERDGRYFFYFCANGKIGVGSADKPTGPFPDALGKPLAERVGKVNTNTIDPYPFIDDDGQAYLYFGNGVPANVFRLKPDMVTLDGEPLEVHGLKDFREGIVVFKRRGKYYFMWSVDDARSDDYRVAYGTANSPLGPVECPPNNTVLRKNDLAKGTGHHSVVNVPGTDRWYAVYHRHAIPGGSGYQRETCLARMEFSPDGTIKPMDPLAPAFPPGSAGELIVNGRGAPDRP